VLSVRALNRALLERQRLLRRVPPGGPAGDAAPAGPGATGPVTETIEYLVGMQAQAPFPPYFGLLARLEGFQADDLARLLLSRDVVRIALMRGTIHLVSARDCLTLRPLVQPVLDRALSATFGRPLAGADLPAVAAAGRALTREQPRTFAELGGLLAQTWPGHPPAALAQAVRALVPLVQVPPRAVWGRAGQARHAPAETWLGRPLDASASLGALVRRYLAAFGPATVLDVQAWSGLTRLREVIEPIRPSLRTFRDREGRELFDLPGAPRPDPGTPAPARLIPEYDNLILAHGDRTRVMSEENRKRLFSLLNVFPGTVLVDGFVRGMWRLSRSRDEAALTVELFGDRVPVRDRDEIAAEATRVLAFAAPQAGSRDVRFAPVGLTGLRARVDRHDGLGRVHQERQ
jgi:Winged helix DNA-binding domain